MYLARSSPTVLTWFMDASSSDLQRPHSGTPRPPGASTPSRPCTAVFHWARVAVQTNPTCRCRYTALRARGHSYGRALRGVGDRLLGVACVLLQRGMLFDPDYGSSAPA